ncbi:DNRLRE domain-containing protein [Nonomuraea sp. NPDC049655]|uniref:DNRLRE domain-containing protein n=1 Tax=Nonomuraea sp. NPDC049655 TaxID=3364355 RepID=UPI0037AE5656
MGSYLRVAIAGGLTVVTALASAAAATPAAADPATPPGLTADQLRAYAVAKSTGKPVEAEGSRTERSTTYVLPSGLLRTELSSGPIRIREGGAWKDIDTTLELRDGALRPKAAKADVAISTGGTTEVASLEQKEVNGRNKAKRFGVRWSNKLPKPQINGNVATFKDVIDGGDLVVTALPTGMAHDVVLRRRPAGPVEIPMPVDVDGLTFSKAKNGRLQLATPRDKELIAAAPQPQMWDAAADRSPDAGRRSAVGTEIRKSANGNPVLVLKPDTGFLSDPATTYPVTIDPWTTLTIKTDTFVSSDYTTGQSGSTWLHAGKFGSGAKTARSYFKFDVAPLLGAQIANADLNIYNYKSNACGTAVGSGIQVRRVTAFWRSAELSLGNQPPTTATGAYTQKAAYGEPGCAAKQTYFSIESIVQEWANGTPAYGLQLRAANEADATNWRMYYSSENADAANRPKLVVDYQPRPASAVVTGNSARVTWEPRSGTGQYSLLDEKDGTVVWTGTTPYADVPLGEEGYVSLVVRADSTPFTKYVIAAANPQLNLPPMTVVTSLKATNIEWPDSGGGADEEEFHLTTEDAADTVLPEPATQVATPLGQVKAYSIEAGTPEPVETGDSGGEEAAPEPPADETGDGVAQESATDPMTSPTDMPLKPVYAVEVTPPLTAEQLDDLNTPLEPEPSPTATTSTTPTPTPTTDPDPASDPDPTAEPGPASESEPASKPVEPASEPELTPALAADNAPVTRTVADHGVETASASIARPASAAAATSRVRESWITYEAYIPSRQVKGPPVGCGSPTWYYAGDNRGPGFNTGKYRTRVAIKYDWANKKITGYRSTHPTTRYKLDGGKVVDKETKTAPLTGIDIVTFPKAINSKNGVVTIIHASHNPFCVGGDIDYNTRLFVYRSGKYNIEGWHDQMPNHEVYRQQVYTTGSKPVTRVFTHKMKGLHCLLPVTCSYRSYRYVN